MLEPTDLQRRAILDFALFVNVIVIAQMFALKKLDIFLKLSQFLVLCFDIFRYFYSFQLAKEGAKRCKTRDSFLTFYFDAFLLAASLYYLKIAYDNVVALFSHFK